MSLIMGIYQILIGLTLCTRPWKFLNNDFFNESEVIFEIFNARVPSGSVNVLIDLKSVFVSHSKFKFKSWLSSHIKSNTVFQSPKNVHHPERTFDPETYIDCTKMRENIALLDNEDDAQELNLFPRPGCPDSHFLHFDWFAFYVIIEDRPYKSYNIVW